MDCLGCPNLVSQEDVEWASAFSSVLLFVCAVIACAIFFAAINEGTSECRIAGEVDVDIAGKNVAVRVALLALITFAGPQLVATWTRLLVASPPPLKYLSTGAPTCTE